MNNKDIDAMMDKLVDLLSKEIGVNDKYIDHLEDLNKEKKQILHTLINLLEGNEDV